MSSKQFEDILTQIELLRAHLHDLAKNKSLIDPEIIETSQKLDELLNKYERLLQKKSKNR